MVIRFANRNVPPEKPKEFSYLSNMSYICSALSNINEGKGNEYLPSHHCGSSTVAGMERRELGGGNGEASLAIRKPSHWFPFIFQVHKSSLGLWKSTQGLLPALAICLNSEDLQAQAHSCANKWTEESSQPELVQIHTVNPPGFTDQGPNTYRAR